VLGLVRVADLDEALAVHHGSGFGLTGGLHSLDPGEVERWLAAVQVGNAYVNRTITGAIVGRQPFGGWRASSVGPGAKAGGPGYVAQLARWADDGLPTRGAPPGPEVAALLETFERAGVADDWLRAAAASDQHWWQAELGRPRDPSGLACEANERRHVPHPGVVVRVGSVDRRALRVALALARCGTPAGWSVAVASPLDGLVHPPPRVETDEALAARLPDLAGGRLRALDPPSPEVLLAARRHHVDVLDDPVVANGRLELRWYLREQTVSRTLHRFGSLVERGPRRAGGVPGAGRPPAAAPAEAARPSALGARC
jgi:RHH-type proline utilization regulon transcriptional repressor/proline dehydrogenase/delta 1-pyrroline-5-carboxylate dehydrogenase